MERHEINANIDIVKIQQYILCINALLCKIQDEVDTGVIRAGNKSYCRRKGESDG